MLSCTPSPSGYSVSGKHSPSETSIHCLTKHWYKPNATREEATALLVDAEPGAFLVRKSTSFPDAYGLALKVESVPQGIVARTAADFVRHFLIEATKDGVRLKGCNNEPSFGSLTAFLHQHTLTPMTLPCKLKLPTKDIGAVFDQKYSPVAELAAVEKQTNSINLLYLNACDVETLTGPEAVARGVRLAESEESELTSLPVSLRVTDVGVVLTDLSRTKFFRQNFLFSDITYCGFDPYDRRITTTTSSTNDNDPLTSDTSPRLFGLIVKPLKHVPHNVCHTFAETSLSDLTSALIFRIGSSKSANKMSVQHTQSKDE